jgi:hypothetical protein
MIEIEKIPLCSARVRNNMKKGSLKNEYSKKIPFPQKSQNRAVPRLDGFCRRLLQHKCRFLLMSVRVRFVVKKTMELGTSSIFPSYFRDQSHVY